MSDIAIPTEVCNGEMLGFRLETKWQLCVTHIPQKHSSDFILKPLKLSVSL